MPSPSNVDILSGSPPDGDGARGGVGVGGVALTWKEMENDDDREFTRFGRLSVEGGRAGEIPKITAPDSQKRSNTEGGGCFGGGSYKTDGGWPHIGRPALITAMHQIPIGSTDFWSGARKRRGGDFFPLSSSVIFDSRLFIQSDDPQSGEEREEGRDGDENCNGRSMFYYVNYEVVDSLCQPSRNILTQ